MNNLGGKIILVLGFLLCSGFFVANKCSADASVIINEVAWMGTTASANSEWIELRNLSSANIDLTGWTLSAADGSPKINLKGKITANGYFLLERTSDDSVPGVAADQIYSGALGNGGENLSLKDANGNLADQIDASGGWPGGDNTSKQTMERKDDGSWQTGAEPGGTPKTANSSGAISIEPNNQSSGDESQGGQTDGQSQNNDSTDQNQDTSTAVSNGAIYGEVLINEFVSFPAAGENEWVELYNPSGGKLSLSGWTIADGSGAATPLSGGFDANNYYFFVKEKFKGALNNSGDEIDLYSDTHNLIDRVVYGKYGDTPANNAPAPAQGETCALKVDGQKTLYSKDDYFLTDTPTKGKPNIISAPAEQNIIDSSPAATAEAGQIIITEILPDPSATQLRGEFIELYNNSKSTIDLTGYKIEVDGGRSFEFGKFLNLTRQLPAQSYFPLYRTDSNLILDNNGGTIKLYQPGESSAAQTLKYGVAPAGGSYCDTNYLNLPNADQATKIFLKNSSLSDRWVWSAEPTPGAPNLIKTYNHAPHASFSFSGNTVAGSAINFDASDSFDEDGDVLNYSWDFGDAAGFNSLTIAHTFIAPGNYSVKLTVSDGQASAVAQKTIKVGGLANKSPIVLPKNIISKTVLTAESAKRDSAEAKSPIAVPKALAVNSALTHPVSRGASHPSQEGNNSIKSAVLGIKITVPAAKSTSVAINNLKIGAALKRSGTVIILPGVFGTQYFYIANAGEAAVKIYNYYKRFPTLKIGDMITASGVVGGSAADKYLKTKNTGDIKIIKSGAPLAPEKISALTENNLNKLVKVAGEITARSATQITLGTGTSTIKIYLKNSTGVSAAAFKAGQLISVTGFLTNISGALAITPRMQADLALASSSASSSVGTQDIAFLRAATGSAAWTLPAQENKNSPLIYIIIAAIGAIIIFAGFLLKKYYLNKKPAADSSETKVDAK